MKKIAMLLLALVAIGHWIPNIALPPNSPAQTLYAPIQKWREKNPSRQHLPAGMVTATCLLLLLPREKNPRKLLLKTLIAATLTLCSLEISQVLTPSRTLDPKDILWGVCGATLCLPIAYALKPPKEEDPPP
jgi:glycopeptide antibiotics resistance protein